MKTRRLSGGILVIGTSILAALAVSATPASAQVPWESYAAKFVCGDEVDPGGLVSQGKYRTAVNIHNPHYLKDPAGAPVPLTFFKKVVLSLPQGNVPLRPSCKLQEQLPADHALGVSCANIKAQLSLSGLPTVGDLEGFLVIEVPPQLDLPPPPLDVVVVYTARPRVSTAEVETMDVEPVLPKTILGVPDQDPCPPD